MSSDSGIFITFEGSEGCGKSSQLDRLAQRLRGLVSAQTDVVTIREPGGTFIGEEIRSLLKCNRRGHGMTPSTELLLFAASRAQLSQEVIAPALAAGKIVLCDRFVDSTTVYQGAGRKLDPAIVDFINHFATSAIRLPDATLLFDLTVEVANQRIADRQKKAHVAGEHADSVADRIESESAEFFNSVRQGYLQLAESEPHRFCVINAEPPIDEIEKVIWAALQKRFHGISPFNRT